MSKPPSSFELATERIHLLIDAMTKAKELGDAIVLAEEAGLELDVSIETIATAGRPRRQIVVTTAPHRARAH